MCQMDHLGRFLNLNVWLWSTTLWGSWIPSICHPPAHNLAQKLCFAQVHPILGGFHGNWGTAGRCWSCYNCFWQETAKSLKVWFMVLIVRPKVIKEHKPTPFSAVIPIPVTSNSIFCTSLFTVLRKPLRHQALPSHSSPSRAAAMPLMVYQETHVLPFLKRLMWSCQCGGTCWGLSHLLFLKGWWKGTHLRNVLRLQTLLLLLGW